MGHGRRKWDENKGMVTSLPSSSLNYKKVIGSPELYIVVTQESFLKAY